MMKKPPHVNPQLLKFVNKFPDIESAIRWFETVRWENGPICPQCCSNNVRPPSPGARYQYRCKLCDRTFTIKSGTFLNNTHLTLDRILQIIFLMASSKEKLTPYQISIICCISLLSAKTLMARIQRATDEKDKILDKLLNKGLTEMDP